MLQIFHRVCRVEQRSIFGDDMDKSLPASFFGYPVESILILIASEFFRIRLTPVDIRFASHDRLQCQMCFCSTPNGEKTISIADRQGRKQTQNLSLLLVACEQRWCKAKIRWGVEGCQARKGLSISLYKIFFYMFLKVYFIFRVLISAWLHHFRVWSNFGFH